DSTIIILNNVHCRFNVTVPTAIYTLSLHDALPISCDQCGLALAQSVRGAELARVDLAQFRVVAAAALGDVVEQAGQQQQFRLARSEEHTSELQSRENLVCRLLLEKKKKVIYIYIQR